jgi:hypothetical protein
MKCPSRSKHVGDVQCYKYLRNNFVHFVGLVSWISYRQCMEWTIWSFPLPHRHVHWTDTLLTAYWSLAGETEDATSECFLSHFLQCKDYLYYCIFNILWTVHHDIFAQYEPTGCTVLLPIYFDNQLLHVAPRFCQQPANKHMIHTNCCIYRKVPPDDGTVILLETCRG